MILMGNYKGNPQVEDGYTKISNELLERIYAAHFNPTQFKIILCVLRYTYGFSRKTGKLSNSFIAEATGVTKRNVEKEVSKLLNMKVLIVERYSCTSTKKLGINKKYKAWEVQTTVELDGSRVGRYSTVGEDGSTTVELDGKLPSSSTVKKEKLKENNKEKYKGDSSNLISEDTEGMTFEELQKALEESNG